MEGEEISSIWGDGAHLPVMSDEGQVIMKVASIRERYLATVVELKRDVRTKGGREFKTGTRFFVVDARSGCYQLRTHDDLQEKLVLSKQADMRIVQASTFASRVL